MMKKLQLLCAALALSAVSLNAQMAEVGPYSDQPISQENTLFDLLYTFDIGLSIGAGSNAGVIFINNQY